MSEFDKKKKVEEDPIQSMLERLRQLVDTPVEKLDFSADKPEKAKKPSSAKNGTKKKADSQKKVEEADLDKPLRVPQEESPAAEQDDTVEEEIILAPSEDDVPEEQSTDEEDAQDMALDSEVDDDMLSLFFAPAEETADTQEDVAEASPEAEIGESDDAREYDLLTLEDTSVLDEDEDGRDNSWKNAILFPPREEAPEEILGKENDAPAPITSDSFFFVHEEKTETASGEPDAPTPDTDADWLFRPRHFDEPSFSAEQEEPPVEEPAEEQPIEANEDNGYAVEVEVAPSSRAWYIPQMPKDEPLEEPLPLDEPVHEPEVADFSAQSEREIEPSEPSFYRQPEQEEIDTLDTDDDDDLNVPQVLGDAPEGEEAPESGEEREAIESFSWERVPEKKKTEEKKRTFLASAAAFFKGEAGSAKPKKQGAFFGDKDREEDAPEALSGIYNEAGADYHEYTSRNQIGLFSRRFVALVSSCTLRVIVLAFLCTLLLLLEDLRYLGVALGGFFARPGGMAAAHLFLMIFVILCCIPMLSHAWRHLFNNRVLPEAYLAIGLVCALLYDVFLLLASVDQPYLFGLVPAVGALILSVIDLLKTKGDFASFKLLSSSGDKLACSVSCGAQTKSEALAVVDLEEGTDTRILSVKKVGFAAGFFHRISRICEDGRKNLWLLFMALLSSLATAVVCAILIASHILPQSGYAAVYAFCVTLSFSFPICSLLLHKLPAVQLFSHAAGAHCAVVGEVSALEYCDAAAVAFEDVEAFPARNVRVQRIKLYGDAALDHVLYRVAGLFSVVGGPLDGVFRSSTAEVGLSAEVRLLRAEEGGIIASVDGHEVCVGRGEYMLSRGIRMYYDPEDEQSLLGGKINIMYAAEDGRLVAKFYVRYKMDEDFERDVEELHKRGIRAIIRTYDPNITEGLVAGISYTERFDVRVVRKTVDQQNDFAADRLNSGIVCKTSCRDILRTLFACRRMCQVIRIGENCNLLVACFGMLLSLLLCSFGVIFSVPSVLLALYQLLWVGLISLAGKLYI